MIIDTNKPVFIYVKNTRVCGTTLLRYIRQHTPPNFLISQNHPSFRETRKIFFDYFINHGIAKELSYISVVRNPYTHAVSYWLFDQFCHHHNVSFKESLLYKPNGMGNIVGLQQHMFVYDEDDMVDHLLRFEDGNVVSRVLDIAGIEHSPEDIGHFSYSRYKKEWWEYYTPDTIKLVRELFAKDFEVLGYDTEFPH